MNWTQLRTDAKRVLRSSISTSTFAHWCRTSPRVEADGSHRPRHSPNECNFLILDEPTAPLSDTETAELFRLVKHLQENREYRHHLHFPPNP